MRGGGFYPNQLREYSLLDADLKTQVLGYLQKVSRPTVECHELSHTIPTRMHVAEKTMVWQYQGVTLAPEAERTFAGDSNAGKVVLLSIMHGL